MCGIAGFTHKHARAYQGRIRDITRVLHHRGPDQQGVWESDAVSLGAVRLAIIDVAGGDQPIEAGGTVIVFNGEIYNHAELRRELESIGHAFHTRCDTEVVLHAFLEWDTGAFARLRGMFAVALWTEANKRLVLARDRMGIKPLYLHTRGADLYFASELKAILAHPEVERRLDIKGLSHYLSLNYVPYPYTLIHGVRKLAPGHWLEWRDGRITSQPYWILRFAPDGNITLEDAKRELDRLLHASVHEHLISDVPLGVWASGGVDSSTILHYAAEGASQQLKTFSVSFRGESFDESPYFREVVARYNTEHHEFDLNPEAELEQAIREIAWYSDEPSADAGALPVWFLSKMTCRHVTVALSGEGADELFGGYYTYLADRYAAWLRLTPPTARRVLLKALRYWPVSDTKISLEYKLKRFLSGSLLDPFAAHFYWNGTFTADEKARLVGSAVGGSLPPAPLPETSWQSGRVNQFLWLDQVCYLPDDILYKCDRMSMAHSLEVRPPFLDHRIVEFAAKLPENLKIRGSRLKFVLKELMRDKLPRVVLTRSKEGFDIPAHGWFRGPLRPLLYETLTREAVKRTGILRWEFIERLLAAHDKRRANLGYHLWGLMTLFLWMKRWSVEPPQAAAEPAALSTYTTN